jgi:septal ring factor EnvC (AmiA/AmiB activator)
LLAIYLFFFSFVFQERNQQLLTDRDRDFENIHKELCQIKHMNSGLMRHVQDLEQKNDDLERAKR